MSSVIGSLYNLHREFLCRDLLTMKEHVEKSNEEKWSDVLFNKLWLPLNIFESSDKNPETKRHFNWLQYYHILNDIQFQNNNSGAFLTKNIEGIIQIEFEPLASLMMESVKRLFGTHQLRRLANVFMNNSKKKHHATKHSLKFNVEIVILEMQQLKYALKCYMGVMQTKDIILAKQMNKKIKENKLQHHTLIHGNSWQLKIQDQDIHNQVSKLQIYDLFNDSSDEKEASLLTKNEIKDAKERIMKKQTNTFFSKALVQSFHRYFTTQIYLQKNLISYQKGEFEPIFNEQLSLMTPSKDFKWYSTTEKYFSNDICINITFQRT